MTRVNLRSEVMICFLWLAAIHSLIEVVSADEDRLTAVQTSNAAPLAALFEEDVLADNVAAVRRRAAAMLAEKRFEYLSHWVLPSETHWTIRMRGAFAQTDPPPMEVVSNGIENPRFAVTRGGNVVSPVDDLLDVAKEMGRLDKLLSAVEGMAEPVEEEQQRARAALLMLIHLEMGQQELAAKAGDRLLTLVVQSTPRVVADMWPEMLVVHRAVIRHKGNPAADELLAWLFANRSQREHPYGLLAWHNQIASLAGRNGHIETPRPDPNIIEPPDLNQWIPVSRLRSSTRGPGLPQALWGRQQDRVDKTSGHDEDYLFFRSPLTGSFEMECDLSPSASQAMVAGTVVGTDSDLSQIWIGTFRDGARRQPVDFHFSGFGKWVHYRCVVQGKLATTYLNGQVVRTEQLDSPDPWVTVRSWSRSHGSVRDLRITGDPVIPESIHLSGSSDLRGWYSYHEEPVGNDGARWVHRNDPESTGQIFGQANAPHGSYFESLLAYQRPLEEIGSIDYEFFYKRGVVETHPALDRMAFLLTPEGVKIHWVTDSRWDSGGLAPDNLTNEPAYRRGPADLPLKPDAWNQLKLAVSGNVVALSLNGLPVYECELDPSNHRTFGLFHYADQTQALVRNVTMHGNWPKRLPTVADQELADPVAIQLDRDVPKLTHVFTHDFGTEGFPGKYFASDDTDQRGQLSMRSDGAFVTRPGEGVWLDRNIRVPFVIQGDFDIEVAFDQLKMQSDKDSCIMLGVQLDDELQHQCRMLRIRTEAKLQQVHASLSVIHKDGGRSFGAQEPTACEATKGRLRLARRGTTLHYLFAENDSAQFRVIGTEQVSDKPCVPDGITLHTLCHGSGETQVLWKSITLRSSRILMKSTAAD